MRVWIGPVIGVLGVVIVAAAAILGWFVIPDVIDNRITDEVRLVNGSDTWNKWQDIKVPIHFKFNIYNITNPDEVENGAKPIIVEKGPYAYREARTKVNLSLLERNRVVQYEQIIQYFWDKEASCDTCDPEDQFNIVNVPFLSVLGVLLNHPILQFLAPMIANQQLPTEKFIRRNVTVRELTFEGFDVSLYTNNSLIGDSLPAEFSEGKFGLYKLNNNTADGVYQVYTGTGQSSDFGRVKTFDGSNVLSWWEANSTCAAVNGTDGSIFPPFVEKSWVMYVFSSDLCRSLYLTYEKEVEHRGLKGYRFVAPSQLLEDVRTNPDNRCFCAERNIANCPRGGVLPISGCKNGAPIVLSMPHFFNAWEGYLNESGLTAPQKDLHETIIDVEPNSGLNLAANKRIQINLETKRIQTINALANIAQYRMFPLLWVDEEARLDAASAEDLKGRLLTPIKIVNISKWAGLGVGLLLVGIGLGVFIVWRRNRTTTV